MIPNQVIFSTQNVSSEYFPHPFAKITRNPLEVSDDRGDEENGLPGYGWNLNVNLLVSPFP